MISPDESTMVFTSDRTRAFWYDVCLSTDGNKATGLVGKKSRYNRYPDFAPDGERIIFVARTKFGNGNRPIFSLWEVSTTGNSREIASDQLFTDPANYNPQNAEQQYVAHGAAGRAAFGNNDFRRGPVNVAVIWLESK